MLVSTVLINLGDVALQLHFTCSATLFLSFKVRACCDFAVDFASKKVVSVVVIFKIEVACNFYVTSKESALPGVFVDFSGARGELPPPCYGCRRLLASSRGIKLSLRTCRSNSVPVSFYFTQTFPEKVVVVSNQAMFNSFVRRKKQSLPDVRLHVGSSIDRYASGSANRQGPAATRRSLQIATHVDRFRSTPNCNHKCNHRQLARLTSYSFVRVGNESRFEFLFSESGREECSSGRNDAPGLRVLGATLRLHQVFWSQNLAFQSQNATMRPDFSSPDSETPFFAEGHQE